MFSSVKATNCGNLDQNIFDQMVCLHFIDDDTSKDDSYLTKHASSSILKSLERFRHTWLTLELKLLLR